MHRPPEGQERNGVTRAQSRTRGRGGGGEWMDWAGLGDGFGPPRLGVGDMAKISYQVFFYFFLYHDSRFYHDSLSCWFFYFASCLSITAKLISLL